MKFLTKSDISIGSQLGSQMSQYASLFSLSQKTKHSIVFNKEDLNIGRGIKILKPFDLKCQIKSKNENIQYSEFILNDQIELDQNFLNLSNEKNWNVFGVFNTFIYWDDYRKEILKEFQFKNEILNKSKNYLNNISGIKVSIHFRRTDYLKVSSMNLTEKYYKEAISIISKKISNFKLIVFSDDIEWCKQNIKGDNIIYCENFINYEDMCIMSLCDHNIIANSCFSWWGAYLNQNLNKIIVCPNEYANDTKVNFMNGKYFPKEWTSIKT